MAGGKKRMYSRVWTVELQNRHSAVYFFVTTIMALVIVELVRFLVQLEPVEGAYYRVIVYWSLLPQVIGLIGCAFLLFECYRRVGLLFLQTQVGKVITVFLCFAILLGIYIFAFARPHYWVFVSGFNLLGFYVKLFHMHRSLRGRLQKAKIEKNPSSKWLIKEMKDWTNRTLLYGLAVFFIGLVIYVPMMQAIESCPVSPYGFRITPVIVNCFTLLVFLALAGAAYYWSPMRATISLFSEKKIRDIKRNLNEVYKNLGIPETLD